MQAVSVSSAGKPGTRSAAMGADMPISSTRRWLSARRGLRAVDGEQDPRWPAADLDQRGMAAQPVEVPLGRLVSPLRLEVVGVDEQIDRLAASGECGKLVRPDLIQVGDRALRVVLEHLGQPER